MTATTTPRSTARLQLHREFDLDAATAVVPYLADLGISHVYTSPLLTARPGSMHGYDIVDHTAINPELGGEPALHRLVAALRSRDMGLVVDIVPNHMGVGGADNAWWLNVLEWGRSSPYAGFFDIDWTPPDRTLHGKLMTPFLGGPYGTCLEAGDIKLQLDPKLSRLQAVYAEHVFPIAPRDYAGVFGDLLDPSASPGRALSRDAAAALKRSLAELLATPGGATAIAHRLAGYDATTEEGRARLHALLERQNFRLVWWRAAADEINYRRFFDITSLAGMRVEVPQVFDATHELLLRLYADGLIDGMRVDHVDGLADPRGYCRKLRRSLETAGRRRPADAPAGAPYIVVEKILAPHERLPADWLTDGTTGYDFMDQVGAVLHDPAGEQPLTALWAELTGGAAKFADEEESARRLTLRDALASELNATSAALHRIGQEALATRDYTLTAIRRALVELLVHFPSYRIYAGQAGRSPHDDAMMAWAAAGAKRTMRAADWPLIDLLVEWLGGAAPRALPPGPQRARHLRGIVRFEQLSSPVAAKSVEDTAFYRYGRLLSRNEVGSNPGNFSLSVAAFHAACRERGRNFPRALLATATHDHKRGEDLRIRLAVLSEIPEEWAGLLQRWMRLNAPLRRDIDGAPAPDAADEIMLYQMLVAAWDVSDAGSSKEAVPSLIDRIWGWQEKALREAKRHSAWVAPAEGYESAVRQFLTQILDPARVSKLGEEIAAFARRIAVSGAVNSLSQLVLRMTTPGVPDLYQGTDLWDFSLVDPDNRRPVDYATRARLHRERQSASTLLDTWTDGRIKQAVLANLLTLRGQLPDLFADGNYTPVKVEGERSEHVIAFLREHGATAVIVLVTRLSAALLGDRPIPSIEAASWGDTRVALPAAWTNRSAKDVLGGSTIRMDEWLSVSAVLSPLPVAVLTID